MSSADFDPGEGIALDDIAPSPEAVGRSDPSTLWTRFRSNRFAIAGLVVLVAIFLMSLFAGVVARYDPNKQDLLNSLQGPSAKHWMGTDEKGRDVFTRLLYAGRVAFEVSLLSVGIAAAIGVPIGLFVGYRGGWWDRIAMRIVDAIVTIPPLVSILALIGVLGTGIRSTAIALGFVFSTSFLRLTRGEVLAVREELFVDAAQVSGVSNARIMWRHILPVASPPLIVQATLMLGAALLAEAGLSFLGVGVQVPDASWGSMLANAQAVILLAPGQAIPPGLAILVTVLCVNLVGDGLRDSMARESSVSMLMRSPSRRDAVESARPVDLDPVGLDKAEHSLLRVDDLEIGFPRRGTMVPAVTEMSFSVGPGETVALVGESGCGKSITALAIAGLLPAPGTVTSGRVELRGTDLLGLGGRELRAIRGRDIGMVFQEPSSSLNPAFTVGDQLEAPLRQHLGLSRRAARKRAIELLERVGIQHPEKRIDQYPYEFSGGMAQRVMIAIALACEPSLLLADEPTTALDVTVQNQVLDLLRTLQAEMEMGIVFVTHDLAVVADIADRTVVLYAGEVVEQAPVEALFTDPRHPYTKALLDSVPRVTDIDDTDGIPGSVPGPGDWPTGCRFAPRCEFADDDCRAAPVEVRGAGDHRFRCIKDRPWIAVAVEPEMSAQ